MDVKTNGRYVHRRQFICEMSHATTKGVLRLRMTAAGIERKRKYARELSEAELSALHQGSGFFQQNLNLFGQQQSPHAWEHTLLTLQIRAWSVTCSAKVAAKLKISPLMPKDLHQCRQPWWFNKLTPPASQIRTKNSIGAFCAFGCFDEWSFWWPWKVTAFEQSLYWMRPSSKASEHNDTVYQTYAPT